MISAGDLSPIRSKNKAITALLPYVIWKGQDGQHKVFDVCLHAARASKNEEFLWYYIRHLPIDRLLNGGSPVSIKQAFILMSPHLAWRWDIGGHDWVQVWAAAASAVPYTDEISQSVADALLYIASNTSLQSHIPPNMWSWLRKSPLLPPVSAGRSWGSGLGVMKIVQGLGDIEILTAYLLLVLSEWESPATCLMCTLIRDHFSGIRVGYHRNKLLQHLDHVLGQLRLDLEYLQQHVPWIEEDNIQWRQGQYGELREVLLEVDKEATELLICEPSRLFILFGILNSHHS